MPFASTSVLRLQSDDQVAVALNDLAAYGSIGAIPRGHKVAMVDISAGQQVRKFGQPIGEALCDIRAGEHVHVHNLKFQPDKSQRGIRRDVPAVIELGAERFFQGILRADGRVATRNYVGIICSVNCSSNVARAIADKFRLPGALDQYPGIDGVVALTHRTGCGIDSEGEPVSVLRRTLGGYARHPNFAGVLLVGLGCEANQISRLVQTENLVLGERLKTLVIQEAGGTSSTIRRGEAMVREMLSDFSNPIRQSMSIAHLSLALQCGGSDGFSALSANPALGVASDLLIRHGGTAILSETPEIYGAEHLLLQRANSEEVANRLLERIEWWEAYAKANGGSLDNNPSPGNKAGGLTTILEKSLGAVCKAGNSPLMQVLLYAEQISQKGLIFMDAPGFDPVSATGQIASGANIMCFTTGRGSCFGAKPIPSLKLATNSTLFSNMKEDIDINCGEVLDGISTIQEMGEQIFEHIIEVASGKKTSSEILGYGEDEFAPWQLGATY
jgi:altronate hydrolase